MSHLVLLDLDGTLIDSFRDIFDAARGALLALQRPLEDQALWPLVHAGSPLEEIWEAAGGQLSHDYQAFFMQYRQRYLPASMRNTRPYPGVVETLTRLRGQTKLVVATAKPTHAAEHILEHLGFLHLFDAVAGSEDIPAKPHPAVLHRGAERAGVPLAGAILVGDTHRDVMAAKAAGIRSVAVTYGGGKRHELTSADHHLDRFDDLLGLVAPGT